MTSFAVKANLVDLFHQVLLTVAVSVENTAPKEQLPSGIHLLTNRQEREEQKCFATTTTKEIRLSLKTWTKWFPFPVLYWSFKCFHSDIKASDSYMCARAHTHTVFLYVI